MTNNHLLTQNLYYNYYYPKPKYQIIGYLDPLGYSDSKEFTEMASSGPSQGLNLGVGFRV